MGGHTAPVKISTAVKALELDFVVQFFELLSVREFSRTQPLITDFQPVKNSSCAA